MENFAVLARALIEAGGAIPIGSASELAPRIIDLLQNPELRQGVVENGRKVLQAHRGATAKTAALISNLKLQAG